MVDSFPASFIDVLKDRIPVFLSDHQIVGRALRAVDPNYTIGVFSVDWRAVQDSFELGGTPVVGEPTLARYTISIQNIVKGADEEEARRICSANAKMIRAVLYRDTSMKVSFGQLSETVLSRTERYKRHGIARQRFAANEVRGGWIFLATTEAWFETESS